MSVIIPLYNVACLPIRNRLDQRMYKSIFGSGIRQHFCQLPKRKNRSDVVYFSLLFTLAFLFEFCFLWHFFKHRMFKILIYRTSKTRPHTNTTSRWWINLNRFLMSLSCLPSVSIISCSKKNNNNNDDDDDRCKIRSIICMRLVGAGRGLNFKQTKWLNRSEWNETWNVVGPLPWNSMQLTKGSFRLDSVFFCSVDGQ